MMVGANMNTHVVHIIQKDYENDIIVCRFKIMDDTETTYGVPIFQYSVGVNGTLQY